MANPAWTVDVAVRFSDLDSMGHVNNARFLTYLEEARLAFLGDLTSHGLAVRSMILGRVEIDYVRPLLRSPPLVQVETGVVAIGTRSFTLGCVVRQGGQIAARARTVLVGYDYEAGASRALTDSEREVLQARIEPTG